PFLPFALPALGHPALPARHITVPTTSHTSAPDQICQNCKPNGPENREAQDHDGDPGRLSPVVKAFDHLRHRYRPHVNVIYIYIRAAGEFTRQGESQRKVLGTRMALFSWSRGLACSARARRRTSRSESQPLQVNQRRRLE